MHILTFSLLAFLLAATEAKKGRGGGGGGISVDPETVYKVLAIIFAVLFALQFLRAIAFLMRQRRIEEVFPFRRRFGWLALGSTLFFVITYASYAKQDYNLDIAGYILFPLAIVFACAGLLLLVRYRRNAFHVEAEMTAGSNERTIWGRFAYTILPIVCMGVIVVTTIALTILHYAPLSIYTSIRNADLALNSLFYIAYIFLVASIVFSSANIWRRIKLQPSPSWEVYDLNVSNLSPSSSIPFKNPNRLTRLTGPPSHHTHNLSHPFHRRIGPTHPIHRLQRRTTTRVLLLVPIPTKPRNRLHYYPRTSLDCHSPSSHFTRKTT